MQETEGYFRNQSKGLEDEEDDRVLDDTESTEFPQLIKNSRARLEKIEDRGISDRIKIALNNLESLFEVTEDSSVLEDLIFRLDEEVMDEEDDVAAEQNLGYIEKDINKMIH